MLQDQRTACMAFCHGLLEEFEGQNLRLIVSYDTHIRINAPHRLEEDFLSLYQSPDTDVFVLLIDLVAHEHLRSLTTLEFHTGKGNKFINIDVIDRVRSIGHQKCQGLIGVHNFTGVDWGVKFVGVTKKRSITEYFKLSPDDSIIDAFLRLGKGPLSSTELVEGKLPEEIQPLGHFVCHVYSANCLPSLPELRRELFR